MLTELRSKFDNVNCELLIKIFSLKKFVTFSTLPTNITGNFRLKTYGDNLLHYSQYYYKPGN